MNLKPILLVSAFAAVGAANAGIVINKVYGGGGSTASVLKYDYVELYNNGTASASLGGLSLQYGSAAGNFGSSASNIVVLNTFTLAAGQSYLLQLGTASGGVEAAAAADQVGGVNLSGTAGKLVLYKGTTNVNALDPTPANVLDLVGYGSTANRYEGTSFAPATTTTTVISRTNGIDTNQNSVDFKASNVTVNSFRNSSAVPEPASMVALGLGAVAMVRRRRASK